MKISKKYLIAFPASALLLGLVAWSPPSSEDVIVGSTTMTSPTGQIAVVGTASSGKAKSALIVGVNHTVSAGSGQLERVGSIVAGNANNVDASATLVSGNNNQAVSGVAQEVRNSGIIGANNNIANAHGYIMGYNNTVSGDYGTAIGYGLNVPTWAAVAVGKFNATMPASEIFTIGAGANDTERYSALSVDGDGVVTLGRAQGDISMGIYGGE